MSEKSSDVIRVGSRKSELALIQTKHVISRLQKLYPEDKFEIHTMSTIGDRVLNISLPKIGEKSLFTRDLEDALLKGGVDFVVHSLKDLPTALPPGMTIGAVLEREDSRDALVLNEKYKGMTIEKLPAGCVIGTSSLRRTAQLRRKYPHLEVCDIRGNLNTRLAKLDAPNSKFAGIILAQAGLLRMGWNNRISQILEPAELLYAVGQGALAVECRANDNKILNMVRQLMCLQTMCRILAERSFLKTLGGGCSAPVAVCTNLLKPSDHNNKNEIQLEITGAVWSLDGTTQIQDKIDCFLNLHCQEISETEEDEDVSPRKRVKRNESSENDENLNKKQGSPKVINDDLDVNRAGGDGEQVADLNHLIELHGELFKRCPFYSLHQRDKDNGNAPSAHECPLKIPVGQDFMGKCPYVGTQEKVDLCQTEGTCPVTGNVIKNVSTSKKPPKVEENKIDGASTSKCPFASKIADLMPKTAEKLQNQDITPKDCPFLQKNIKLVDYEANKANISEVICSLPDVSDELFCGLFRHKCYSQNIYTKCESLGQKLADNLIRNGALDVMKCAQDEIREKV